MTVQQISICPTLQTMAHGPGLFQNDVLATLRRDAYRHETPALGIFEVLSRFVKAGDEHHFQAAKPSTSFVSSLCLVHLQGGQ